ETAVVAPSWGVEGGRFGVVRAGCAIAHLTGSITAAGALAGQFAIDDGVGIYSGIKNGPLVKCANCYRLTIAAPVLPGSGVHRDVQFVEHVGGPLLGEAPITLRGSKAWALHVGDSFADVPRTHPYYEKIETILHHGITSGCSATEFCPSLSVSRGQIAI